jgi:hypothetical protein
LVNTDEDLIQQCRKGSEGVSGSVHANGDSDSSLQLLQKSAQVPPTKLMSYENPLASAYFSPGHRPHA